MNNTNKKPIPLRLLNADKAKFNLLLSISMGAVAEIAPPYRARHGVL